MKYGKIIVFLSQELTALAQPDLCKHGALNFSRFLINREHMGIKAKCQFKENSMNQMESDKNQMSLNDPFDLKNIPKMYKFQVSCTPWVSPILLESPVSYNVLWTARPVTSL